MKKEKSVAVKVRLPVSMYKDLKTEACQEYATTAAIIRRALADHVKARQTDMAILAERESLSKLMVKKGRHNP